MTRTSQKLGAVSLTALAAFSATPALAQQTPADTTIRNEVSVSYNVGGTPQTAVEAFDEFLVDRKVNLTVEETDNAATIVQNGDLAQVTTFQVQNLSNDTIDLDLSVLQQAGGAAAFNGTDNFDVIDTATDPIRILIAPGSGADFADAVEAAYIDEILPDQIYTVFVVADIPTGLSNDDVATIALTADAHAGGTVGSLGTELSTSATNDPAVVDTVLADGDSGFGDDTGEFDGAFAARDDYRVIAANVTVAKTSRVIDDGVGTAGGGSVEFYVPGATVEYCIAVSNAAGAATASGIAVSDTLPANVTYVSDSIVVNGSTDASGTCLADGVAGTGTNSNYDATDREVTADLLDVGAGESRTLIFQVTIDE